MTGITRKGTDAAGGTLTGGSGNVNVNGAGAVRVGDGVIRDGLSPHDAPTMSAGSGTVKVNGIAVCRAGDAATCGHTASGSGNVNAGG